MQKTLPQYGSLLLVIVFLLAFAVAAPVGAQESDLPPAGLTPASPFYFVERVFEGIGTFFAFGDAAKAERYLALAEERLAEAQALAEEGDERAQEAVTRFEGQGTRAKERAEETGDVDLEAIVTDATTKHLSVLDEVIERVREEAKEAIRAAKERSMRGQIEALRGIAQRDPEKAVDLFARAAEGRLLAAQARAERGGDDETEAEEVEEALEEFNEYAAFGEEISTLAEGLQTGETTVEELIERATSHHLKVLQDVRSKVPFQAQDGIRRAMDSANRVRNLRPSLPTQPQRSQQQQQQQQQEETSEDAGVDSTPVDLPPQAGQGDDAEEEENGAGGPPQDVIPDTPGP